MSTPPVLDRFRQPNYTGENRCLPCTVVNLALAAAASLAVGVVSPVAGVAVAGVAVVLIYFRGYLVPGTPTLTKRYLPDRVLRRFDKAPAATIDADRDPESQLLALGVVEPVDDDLRSTEAFAAEWEAAAERVSEDLEARVTATLDVDDPEIREREDACLVLDDGAEVARWPSRAALVADLAAMPILRERTDNWDDVSRGERAQLLGSLRIFLEACPDCGGALAFGEESVESCCRSVDVVTYDCTDCDARVFEVEQRA